MSSPYQKRQEFRLLYLILHLILMPHNSGRTLTKVEFRMVTVLYHYFMEIGQLQSMEDSHWLIHMWRVGGVLKKKSMTNSW